MASTQYGCGGESARETLQRHRLEGAGAERERAEKLAADGRAQFLEGRAMAAATKARIMALEGGSQVGTGGFEAGVDGGGDGGGGGGGGGGG